MFSFSFFNIINDTDIVRDFFPSGNECLLYVRDLNCSEVVKTTHSLLYESYFGRENNQEKFSVLVAACYGKINGYELSEPLQTQYCFMQKMI